MLAVALARGNRISHSTYDLYTPVSFSQRSRLRFALVSTTPSYRAALYKSNQPHTLSNIPPLSICTTPRPTSPTCTQSYLQSTSPVPATRTFIMASAPSHLRMPRFVHYYVGSSLASHTCQRIFPLPPFLCTFEYTDPAGRLATWSSRFLSSAHRL